MAKRDSPSFGALASENANFHGRNAAIVGIHVSHSEHGGANSEMVALTARLRPIHLDKQHVKPIASAAAKRADQSGVEIPMLWVKIKTAETASGAL